jgi:hypothetical protein
VVEVATRDRDGSLRSVIQRGLEGHAQLTALGVELDLEEIFARVALTDPERAEGRAPAGGTERKQDRVNQGQRRLRA